MRITSLKYRITFLMVFCLLAIFTVNGLINHYNQNESITKLNNHGTSSLLWSLNNQIEFIMLNGANEELQPMALEAVDKGVIDGLTIVDDETMVTSSSEVETLHQLSADPAWREVFRSGENITFDTVVNGEPMQYSYWPFRNLTACQDCHDDQPADAVLGGLKIVKSKQEMASMLSDSMTANILLSALCGSLLVLIIFYLLNIKIFKPLDVVSDKLVKAADGEINQIIEVKSKDEIGRLLQAIKKLIDYINVFERASSRIAENDLTVEVEPVSENDSLGHSFKKMLRNLSDMVGKITENTGLISEAVMEISLAAGKTTQGAASQTDQIQQISTAIEQMSATIIESSRNTGEVSNFSRNSADTATTGGDLVGQTIQGIDNITNVTRQTGESIDHLAKSSEDIGEIVRVIDDIADQTNLLALNAAIEAARAGEHGRGFAVVADEVRKLADKTMKATGEINEMIKTIQAETKEAVRSMDAGIEEVNKSAELADSAGRNMQEVVTMSQRVMDMIQQVASATEQQSVATEEISQRVENITTITRETSANAEKSSKAADQLRNQTESLKELVEKFKIAR